MLVQRSATSFLHNLKSRSFATTVATAPNVENKKTEWANAKPFNSIPGPKSYPILGSIPSVLPGSAAPIDVKKMHIWQQKLFENYGPIVKLEFPFQNPMLYIFESDLVNSAMKHGVSSSPIRGGMEFLKYYRKEMRGKFYNNAGVMCTIGEEWHDIRSKAQGPMLRLKHVTAYSKAMDEIALEFCDHIKTIRNKDGEVGYNSDFVLELQKWALESISVVAVNDRLGCIQPAKSGTEESIKLIKSVSQVLDACGAIMFSALPLWNFYTTKAFKQLMDNHDTMSEILRKRIDKAAVKIKNKPANSEDKSILEIFFDTPGMTREDAYTMAVDMVGGGVDTTGTTMGMVLYNVARCPHVQRQLQKEVAELLPDPQQPITKEILDKMRYIKATLKETLRATPTTVGYNRTIESDIVLGGYQVPRGTEVLPCVQTMGQREKYYPDPLYFKPERFLRDTPEHHFIDPYAYLPFGHGPRACIGRRLAEQEIHVLLARIIQKFRIEYDYEPLDFTTRLVNAPDKPLKFKLLDRK